MSKKNKNLIKERTKRTVKSRAVSIRSPGKKTTSEYRAVQSLILYRFVFSHSFSLMGVFVLLVSFLMQGLYMQTAYASEIEMAVEENSVVENLVVIEEESQKFTVSENPPEIILEEDLEIESVQVQDIGSDNYEVQNSSISSTLDGTESATSSNNENGINNDVDENPEITSQSENTNSTDVTDSRGQSSTSDFVNENEEDLNEDISNPPTRESISVTNSDSVISFNKDECMKVSDGSFYCHQPNKNILEDSLFAAPDRDGDLEIFLVRDGRQIQITNNQVEDASPYFDSNSNTIVWHRLIDDRYQIISYDVKTGKETQLTHGSVNNMEPAKQGNYTVWQRWLGSSWNIILHDGNTERIITNDRNHNVGPKIQGSLVIWNKHKLSGEKTIEIYDIDNDSYFSIDDPDGLSVDNPRMVLVYDSLHPNGDIETRGFDILSRQFIRLDTLPKNLPDIPNSESTSEVRALIQSKPEIESAAINNVFDDVDDDQGVEVEEDDLIVEQITPEEIDQETFSDDFTLDLSQNDENPEDEFEHENEISEEIPDLEIPPFSESSTTDDAV